MIKHILVNENGKQYYIDSKGNRVSNKYDIISCIEQEGMIKVKVNGKWGFINKRFQEVVAPQYEQVGDFYEGLALVRNGEKVGAVSKRGTEVVKVKYDSVFVDGRFIYKTLNGEQKKTRRSGR